MDPCPWCGATDAELGMRFFFGVPVEAAEGTPGAWHALVICRRCQAQGPPCHAAERGEATEKSVARWNTRDGVVAQALVSGEEERG
ncbi:MAG: hypothetical protein HQL66_02260 [Magnetococcales bacterium]|nr:hypothetical protein [Magnetococcales bacterium]